MQGGRSLSAESKVCKACEAPARRRAALSPKESPGLCQRGYRLKLLGKDIFRAARDIHFDFCRRFCRWCPPCQTFGHLEGVGDRDRAVLCQRSCAPRRRGAMPTMLDGRLRWRRNDCSGVLLLAATRAPLCAEPLQRDRTRHRHDRGDVRRSVCACRVFRASILGGGGAGGPILRFVPSRHIVRTSFRLTPCDETHLPPPTHCGPSAEVGCGRSVLPGAPRHEVGPPGRPPGAVQRPRNNASAERPSSNAFPEQPMLKHSGRRSTGADSANTTVRSSPKRRPPSTNFDTSGAVLDQPRAVRGRMQPGLGQLRAGFAQIWIGLGQA